MPKGNGCYDLDPDLTQYYQGDILRDIPFPTWPTLLTATQTHKWAILRPLREGKNPSIDRLPNHLNGRAQSDVSDAFQNLDRKEFIMASCQLRNVMVLTRSCQLDHSGRKHSVVAPVTAVADLPEQERKPDALIGLRSGQIPHKFYLPALTGLDESFADLLKMTYVHRSFLPDSEVKSRLVARLSSVGTSRLQQALSTHFGVSFGFDHMNVCPQDGLYSCSACFFQGRDVTKRRVIKGDLFGPCNVCGEHAEFVKLPNA